MKNINNKQCWLCTDEIKGEKFFVLWGEKSKKWTCCYLCKPCYKFEIQRINVLSKLNEYEKRSHTASDKMSRTEGNQNPK